MKEEKCANYERDNVLMSEMEQNIQDVIDGKDSKIDEKKLNKIVEEIYGKHKRELFLMNAHGVLDTRKCQDDIVESVRQKLLDRSNVGIKKYNTTLETNNKDNYLKHLQEELMDATLYVQKLTQQQIDITELVASESNDWELGKLLRKIYGKV